MIRAAALAVFAAAWANAQVCNPALISGAYGMQLTGTSTISGKPTPVAAVGRVVFESGGAVSGYSSVNFNGLFLGNPVTGTYQANNDCTLTLELQDDSGAHQHFAGKAVPPGERIELRQTDAGAGSRGVLRKLPDSCGAASLRGHFAVTFDGSPTPYTGGVRLPVSATGEADADGAGGLAITWGKSRTSGTYTVDADCFVESEIALPMPDGQSTQNVKLRGVLVNGGKEVLAVQTDPERVAGARFLAR